MSKSTTSTIRCPGCGKFIDEAFYPQHIESGHTLYVIEIKGLNPMVTASKPPTPMIDIPYLGRLRRDGFLAWSLIMLFLGVILAAYAWRII